MRVLLQDIYEGAPASCHVCVCVCVKGKRRERERWNVSRSFRTILRIPLQTFHLWKRWSRMLRRHVACFAKPAIMRTLVGRLEENSNCEIVRIFFCFLDSTRRKCMCTFSHLKCLETFPEVLVWSSMDSMTSLESFRSS